MTNGQIQILCLVLIRPREHQTDRTSSGFAGRHPEAQRKHWTWRPRALLRRWTTMSTRWTSYTCQRLAHFGSFRTSLVRSYSSSCSWGSDLNKDKVRKNSNLNLKNVGELWLCKSGWLLIVVSSGAGNSILLVKLRLLFQCWQSSSSPAGPANPKWPLSGELLPPSRSSWIKEAPSGTIWWHWAPKDEQQIHNSKWVVDHLVWFDYELHLISQYCYC